MFYVAATVVGLLGCQLTALGAPHVGEPAAHRRPVSLAPAADTPLSRLVLDQLPDGEAARRFILDCTGCHQMNGAWVYPGSRVRSEAEWREAIRRMMAMAGPSSSFPVISAERDPETTAAWLAEHFDDPDLPDRVPTSAAAVREYEWPYPGDLPHDLIVDGEGHVVITGMFTDRMLRLDPETGEFAEVPIPFPRANPRALEIDDEGAWWVLLGAANAVARYTPDTGEWAYWPIGMYGHSVRVDDGGRVWFNGHFSADPPVLGYVDPAAGEVRTFDVPVEPTPEAANPIPYGLRIGPDGRVWGTELHGNRLTRLDPVTGAVDVWRLPTSHSGPRRPDVTTAGAVWIPLYAANGIARFDPDTETFTEYQLPDTNTLPYIVRVDDRGRVVVGTGAADAVYRFDPSDGSWATFPLPTRGVLIRHMDLDPVTGDLWVAYGAAPGIPAKIARVEMDPEP